ncbi:DNAJ protein JJJ1 homolog [Mercurialis annua]|uniref:DNAJ protein JJJ1 homolog n=1 Tax=Mercurialis annua TaxID=3986 RepID=UPI00216038BF|nr:DNAJ protein JJJ1 homolog [Mercurialis annua]
MAATEKRCHYEVLGLSRDSTPEEIRAAYKKLALQRHPDKLVKSGLSQAEATAQFQELSQAYEILSDPKERTWYDSHRSQILFSKPNDVNSSVPIPNLFSFFSNTVYFGYTDTGKGFYKVYSDVFSKIYANEVSYCKKLGLGLDNVKEMPVMGNLESPYEQVTAFYNYWLGFATVMDFCWADQYDAMAGVNRKSRRVMEDENKKVRKKAKREFNETVRGLAEFVKKRDKRVIDMMVKRNAEMEKKKAEERERKKKLERERMERARAYEEPEWARADEDVGEVDGFEEEEETENKKGNGDKELYCVVCGKKFKSEKQWKNHEQSKKHKEKVAELKDAYGHEDEEEETEEEADFGGGDEDNDQGTVLDTDELEERFKEGVRISGDENGVDNHELSDEEDGFFDVEDVDEVEGSNVGNENDDEHEGEDVDEVEESIVGNENGGEHEGEGDDWEMSVLKAMLSGHKSRKSRRSRQVDEDIPMEVPVEDVNEEPVVMEYNNRKTRRRKSKKDGNKSNGGFPAKGDCDEKSPDDEINRLDVDKQMEESPPDSLAENKSDDQSNHQLRKNHNSDQPVGSKGDTKKESKSKSKNSKGKKGKATIKYSGNLCEKCGEEFESRTKLHKHLIDTGHALPKF